MLKPCLIPNPFLLAIALPPIAQQIRVEDATILNNAVAGRDETYIPAVVTAVEAITGLGTADFTRENRGLPPIPGSYRRR